MKHYKKQKYQKKITLFSQDATKTLDSSGKRYDWFSWYGIKDFGLRPNSKLKISSIDLKSAYDKNVVGISTNNLIAWYKFEPLYNTPFGNQNLIIHYKFDNNYTNDGTQDVDTQVWGTPSLTSSKFQQGTHSMLKTDTQGLLLTYEGGNDVLAGLEQVSFCCWVYITSTASTQHFVFQTFMFSFRFESDTEFRVYVGNNTSWSYWYTVSLTEANLLNKWTHFAFVIDYSLTNAVAKMYVNAIELGGTHNGTLSVTEVPSTATSALGIGLVSSSKTLGIIGYLDDYRIYNKALTQAELENVFTNSIYFEDSMNYTQMKQEYDIINKSTINHQGNYSLDLSNGNKGASITLLNDDVNVLEGSDVFSVCFWMYLSGTNTTWYYILYQNTGFYIRLDEVNDKIEIALDTQIMTWSLVLANIENVWKHVSVVVDYSQTDPYDKVQLFMDGVNQGAGVKSGLDTLNTSYPNAGTNKLYLGSYNGTQLGFNGYIDDLRIYVAKLEEDDVRTIMAISEDIYTVRCKECYGTYDSDLGIPLVYHNRGTVKNKNVENPTFNINAPFNSLSLRITHNINGYSTDWGLNSNDEFIITLLADNEEKEYIDGNIEEEYHKYPQNYIMYN